METGNRGGRKPEVGEEVNRKQGGKESVRNDLENSHVGMNPLELKWNVLYRHKLRWTEWN